MRNTDTTNRLLVNQIRNLRLSETQVRPIHMDDNKRRENIPELKIRLVYSTNQPAEEIGKLAKSKLYIKNMVSIRCKMVVKSVLENLELNYSTVELGEVELIGHLSDAKHVELKSDLLKYGLELMKNKKTVIVEKIKKAIVEMIHYSDELPDINLSNYLSEKLNHNYTYLSNLFSDVKGMSIQHFVMVHKIERVKELMVYGELTLSEIAWKLHYSSAAHLSNQFKKMTGLTPSHFKNMKHKRRNTLDNI
jgi:AraC-like DNA-binding protein